MKVVELRVADIKDVDRAREELGDIEQLAASIKEKGLIQPITVGPNMRLMAGGRRLAAHKIAGLETIRAIIHEPKDTIEPLEIELIENCARKDLTWQEEAKLQWKIWQKRVAKNRKWTQKNQADMTGRQQPEIHRLLSLGEALAGGDEALETCETKDQAWKAYKALDEEAGKQALRAMLERADTSKNTGVPDWAVSAYRTGNCIEAMAGMEDVAHFAEVDPPYGVSLDRRKGRNADTDKMSTYTEWDDFEVQFRAVVKATYLALKDHSFAVFWYGMSWHSQVMEILDGEGFAIADIPAIWTKGGSGQTASPDTTLGSTYEPFFLARKGQPKLVKPGRGNDFRFNPLHPTQKIHPTEKPLLLLEEIIATCCFPGSKIIVPFLGSGVTLKAAYNLGHTAFGWDLSETFRSNFLLSVSNTEKVEEAELEEIDEEEEV